MDLRLFFTALKDSARSWCKGRNWVVRLPILVGFLYLFIKYLKEPMYFSMLDWLNLGIHELGHVMLMPFGQFVSIMGGTLFQIAAPIFSVFNFYCQDDYFAIALSFGWLSTSLFNSARYIADARALELPLASLFGSENTIHDWNYMLFRMHLLQHDILISNIVRFIASVSMLICLITGIWLLYVMVRNKNYSNTLIKY
jgi:hypothetical protein